MAIGTTAAILIGASVAGGVASAKMQANAARDIAKKQAAAAQQAAAQQQQATDQSLAFLKEMWAQAQQLQQPYAQAGHAAVGALTHGLGLRPGGGPQTGTYAGASMGAARPPAPPPVSAPVPAVPTQSTGGPLPAAENQDPTVVRPVAPAAAMRHGDPAAGPAASAPTSLYQTVRLQAPTGEVRDVPAWQAAGFLRNGAKRVNAFAA